MVIIGADFHPEFQEIGSNLSNHVEKRRRSPRRRRVVRSDVELVDDHVAEVGSDECGIVPGVGNGRTDQIVAAGKCQRG